MTKNSLHGTIPSAYGQLTNLKRLQLSRNSLTGTINGAEFLAPLQKLEIIGLGGNKLTGKIPEEIGSMPKMVYINIPYNDFTGTIPSVWRGDAPGTPSKLKHVSFAFNELTGTIPSDLVGIESLDNLFLQGNNLVGDLPEFVCVGGETVVSPDAVEDSPFWSTVASSDNATSNTTTLPIATYNDMKLTVDCESVVCGCCGCESVVTSPSASDVDIVNSNNNNETVMDIVNSNSTLIGESVVENATATAGTLSPTSGTSSVEGTFSPTRFPTKMPTNRPTREVLRNDDEGYTYVDDAAFDEALEVLNGALPASQASEPYGCQSVSVQFPCYQSGWSIDFDLSNADCRVDGRAPDTLNHDIVALYPWRRGNGQQRPPSQVGTLKSLDDAVYWATSCGRSDCDGVVANGEIYYRNKYPDDTKDVRPEQWWPVDTGTFLAIYWIRVDSEGTAVVLAESRPFVVAQRCKGE